jgi:hypothetical protein
MEIDNWPPALAADCNEGMHEFLRDTYARARARAATNARGADEETIPPQAANFKAVTSARLGQKA